MLHRDLRHLTVSAFGLLALGAASVSWAAAAGDAVRAAGGTTFSANSADAIQETCLDLVAAGDSVTSAQADLRTNCGNMVRTTLTVLGPLDINEYGFETDSELYNGLRQFSGEEMSSQARYATENNNRQLSAIGARMNAARQGTRASGVSMNLQGTDLLAADTESYNAMPLIGGAAGSAGDYGWGWFANFEYGFGDRDGTANENQFDYDAWKVFVGGDYAMSNGWVLGAAFSYHDSKIDFDDEGTSVPGVAGGRLNADGYDLAGFFQYQGEGPLYVNGILSWGQLDYDIKRNVFFESAGPGAAPDRVMDSSTDGDQLEAEFNVGAVFGRGATTFDVFAGVNVLDIKIDGFEENDPSAGGGLALAFDKQNIESLQSIVGVIVRHSFGTNAGVVTPYLGLQWRHEFENDTRDVSTQYAEAIDPNASDIDFLMPTDDPDEDYGKIALGISSQMQNSMFLFFQWETVVGLKDTKANLLTFGLRGVF